MGKPKGDEATVVHVLVKALELENLLEEVREENAKVSDREDEDRARRILAMLDAGASYEDARSAEDNLAQARFCAVRSALASLSSALWQIKGVGLFCELPVEVERQVQEQARITATRALARGGRAP